MKFQEPERSFNRCNPIESAQYALSVGHLKMSEYLEILNKFEPGDYYLPEFACDGSLIWEKVK